MSPQPARASNARSGEPGCLGGSVHRGAGLGRGRHLPAPGSKGQRQPVHLIGSSLR